MDQELIQIIKDLILPPGGLILLGLVGLLLSRRILGKLLLTITLLLFFLISTPFISNQLLSGLERHPAITPDEIRTTQAEAIVVLGGGRYSDAPEYGRDTIGGPLLERVRYAAWVQRRTQLPVIASGGDVEIQKVPEAQLTSNTLKYEYGIKVQAVEGTSVNTKENAHLTKKLLDRLGIKKILLITHAWHMPRALRAFQLAGIKTIPAPTVFVSQRTAIGETRLRDWLPSSIAQRNSHIALHEYLGIAWQWINHLLDDNPHQ